MPHQAHRPTFAPRLSHRDVTTHNACDLSLKLEERRMARVPYVDNKDLPEQYRNQLSSDANVTRALSNSPQLAFLSGSMARYIRHETKVDPRLRELAIIQVGYSARSAYEYTHHIKIGFSFGVTEDDLRAIAQETAGRPSKLEPLAKSVLRAAREMTDGRTVSDKTFAELRAAFDNTQLVELLYAIANYNGVVRILAALQVDLEDEYRSYLEKFPFAA
jgi:alkylhydroperoxidase family enzyme